MNNPTQPIMTDPEGVRYFKRNAIVCHLLAIARSHGNGLNEIAALDFSDDDRRQLAQLIGYRLDAYGELSYAAAEPAELSAKAAG